MGKIFTYVISSARILDVHCTKTIIFEMVIKNWQNQQNSFIFHMTPIAYEEKHCKIAQYCVYVLLSYFVFREKLREGRTKLPGSEASTLHCFCTVVLLL